MLTYPQAVQELYYALFGNKPTNFHADLFLLIGKADPAHRERLKLAFPIEVQVWEEFHASPSAVAFFESYGIKVYT
jgi:hypothetical protein